MAFDMSGLALVQKSARIMVLYLIASVGSSPCAMPTPMTVIVNRFVRFRSRALAPMQLGIRIGSLALPVLAWALETFGWRPVLAVSGLVILAVGLRQGPAGGALRSRRRLGRSWSADGLDAC